VQARSKVVRRDNLLEASCGDQRAPNYRVESGTRRAGAEVLFHRLMLDTRKGVVNERNVTLSECATVHTEGRG
jgi:hypothetical protein